MYTSKCFFSESNSSAEVLISAHLQKVQGHEDKSIPSWTRELFVSSHGFFPFIYWPWNWRALDQNLLGSGPHLTTTCLKKDSSLCPWSDCLFDPNFRSIFLDCSNLTYQHAWGNVCVPWYEDKWPSLAPHLKVGWWRKKTANVDAYAKYMAVWLMNPGCRKIQRVHRGIPQF